MLRVRSSLPPVNGRRAVVPLNQSDPARHAWYYDSLVNAYDGKVPPALEEELRRTVDCLLDRLRSGQAPDGSDVARLRADAAQSG